MHAVIEHQMTLSAALGIVVAWGTLGCICSPAISRDVKPPRYTPKHTPKHTFLLVSVSSSKMDRVTFGFGGYLWHRIVQDWRIADVILTVVCFIGDYFAGKLEPFQRQFYINDLTISHPFAEHERVTSFQLFIYSLWIPAAVIVVFGLALSVPKHKLQTTFISLVGLGVSVTLTGLVTDILKNAFGRHRPDFLARCQPAADTAENVLVFAKDVCTAANRDRLLDGFRTTPSGHSSISFAGLFYLTLWLWGQLVALQPQVGGWRLIFAAIPSVGAALIALSRTEDYRHHFVDVFVGLVLGAGVAYWSYRRLFPLVAEREPFVPYVLAKDEAKEQTDYALALSAPADLFEV